MSEATWELQPGQTLDGRFVITGVICKTGTATVFKATDLLTTCDVALKAPFFKSELSPTFFSRYARESRIGEQLDHPYLLKFIPVEHRTRPYLVTEYLYGHTLAHLMKSVGPMPEKAALRLVSSICEGLSHMHGQGVIHRDLKPHNIMICHDGTIRIMDFGISVTMGRRFSFPGYAPAMGTPKYIAPEQVKGKRGDGRTDIYSLGAILYEMVTGTIPFFTGSDGDVFVAMNARLTGDPAAPRTLNGKLSEQVEEIILHAMERDPGKRYPTALAMKEDLDHPGEVRLTGRCCRLRKPAPWKRHMKNALLIGLVIAMFVLGLVELILLIVRRGP
ncbi:MAG: serine/threonine-protein kinase [Oryzomonas sp.]|uniref:serine/threonine protein kinase n=1 Tax=Oryzomonas sp. TaxID=2855186 RepID=UPI00283D5C09|nr:serine/threonine-protein kinase [Oryzomonas sp.]MDR3581244.1 serine/threonine-protein kinase [Oryzomonas sp.]